MSKRKVIRSFARRNSLSVWLSFVTACVAATMMHPTISSLVALVIILILLALIRWVAHIEGSFQEEEEE